MSKLFALLISVLLLITNPTEPEFEEFVSLQISNNVAGKTSLGDRFASQIVAGFVSKMASGLTERANYYFFSVYTLDMSSLRAFRPDVPSAVKVVGIGGQFIPLTKNPLIK
jgi:hypothetical protein